MTPLERWEQLDRTQQAGLGLLVVLLIGSLIFAAFRLTYTPPVQLAGGLRIDDAKAISAQLEASGIDHEVDTLSGSISVSEADIHRARLAVMGEATPLTGGVGFELFDDVGLGMSEFTQRVNYQRALEGEISRTVSQLEEVERARLHLSLPERSLFSGRQQERPKASLALQLVEGIQLEAARIIGIQELVSSSVPGLLASDVAIHDQSGLSLSVNASTDHMDSALRQHMATKSLLEHRHERKAQLALDQIYGVSRARVMTDVTLSTSGAADAVPGRVTLAILLPEAQPSDARLESLGAYISDAVGLDRERGDSLSFFYADSSTRTDQMAPLASPPDVMSMTLKMAPRFDEIPVPEGAIGERPAKSSPAAAQPESLLVSRRSLLIVVALSFFAIVMLVAVFAWWHRRTTQVAHESAPSELTDGQREVALEELRQWLGLSPEASGDAEANT